MANTDTDTVPVDPDTIDAANHLLRFMQSQANPDWEKALVAAELNDKEIESNTDKVEALLDEMGHDKPVGVVPMGTGQVCSEAGVEGEEGQRAIQLLKSEHRILQAGRGRGRAIIVLSGEAVSESARMPAPKPKAETKQRRQRTETEATPAVTDTPQDRQEVAEAGDVDFNESETVEVDGGRQAIPVDNVAALIAAARDGFLQTFTQLRNAQAQVRRLSEREESYQREISELNQRCAELEAQLNERMVASY